MNKVKVYVEICKEGTILPEYANIGDAGMDIRSAEDITIEPGETKIISTGLKIAVPHGYELQVRPRSGLSVNTPLRISNSPGTIDSGYRGEVGIIINNISPIDNYNNQSYLINEKGNKPGTYQIKKDDRIAQIVLKKYDVIEFVEVKNITEIQGNRGGGFGSSGTN